MTTTLRSEALANGLLVTFADESNRYFGDYHRVCVVTTIICELSLLPSTTEDEVSFQQQAISVLGERVAVVKRLERMGVPTARLGEVRNALVDDFLQHAADYLARPAYPRLLVQAELTKRRTRRYYG